MNTSDLYPRFSDAEFARRYALVRTAMQEVGLSALVLHGTAGSYHEVQYLSNFLVTREAGSLPGTGRQDPHSLYGYYAYA